MTRVFIIIILMTSNVFSVTLDSNNTKLNITNMDCYEKIVKLKNEITNEPEDNSIYTRIVRKLHSIYFSIKYYLLDIYYSFKDKKITMIKPVNGILDNQKLYNEDDYKINRLIAHAGGMINNNTYTNSLEALDENYKNGFRLFELDIRKTSDGIYVAVHEWEQWKTNTKYEGSVPPSLKDFKNYKWHNKYTPLDINDINKWFCEHKNTILVTDKVNSPIDFSKKFIDKKRLLMELFTWQAVIEGAKEGINVMPTWPILSTLKNSVVQALLDLNITAVAASRRVILNNRKLLKELINNHINVYAFHINYDIGKDEKYVICNELNYFYGLYADKWDFKNKLQCK